MARPRKNSNAPSAQERIEAAFLKLLEERGYAGITIGELAAKAGVNHNTIYYYYSNVESVAEAALRNLLLPEQAVKMFTAGGNADKVISEFLSNDDIRSRVHVMQLYASPDSVFLQSLLKKSIYDEALNYTSTKEEDLSSNDRITFEYILSGFISIIGQKETRDNYAAIMSFQNTEFGSHCREALCRILNI